MDQKSNIDTAMPAAVGGLTSADDDPKGASSTHGRLSRVLVIILAIALAASGISTVLVMADYSPLESDLTTVIALLNLDLALALAIGGLLARRIVRVWIGRRFGVAGSRLHLRMVLTFSLVAIIPAILVAVFSGMFLNFGIESWFSERVATAVNQSNSVARLYLTEHRKSIRGDVLRMANQIDRNADLFRQNPRGFGAWLTNAAQFFEFPELVIVNSNGHTIVRLRGSYSLGFDISTEDFLRELLNRRPGEMFMISGTRDDRVRAGVRLQSMVDAYLLVGRFVDQQVLDHISQTSGASAQYRQLQANRDSLQVKFLLVFALVAILLLLTAVWIGWSLANQLSTPIARLIDASERVRRGDLTARVQETIVQRDEIGTLSSAFNRMTERLDSQQRGLIEANRQLDERRRFTETVLAGVSAGVIGLDSKGCVHLPNRSASELLGTDLTQHFDEPFGTVVPEMEELLVRVLEQPDRNTQGEISLIRNGTKKTLLTSVAAERINREVIGYVVTFDDVTELLSAQRKAAWADVARRIAHEIKNPLTPIQLSAERLKRKYQCEIITDPEVFSICTDTIVRQVEDIGRMVDEFSTFARMPQPDLKEIDLGDLCRQSIFLEKNRFPDIEYDMESPEGVLLAYCDRLQIGRALTNILKNAAESINSKPESDDGMPEPGRIQVILRIDGRRPCIEISDNGKGFPGDLFDRITEPYVTTRERGTGLGLAIAKKIAEDHSGELLLRNISDGGASVAIVLGEISPVEATQMAAEYSMLETASPESAEPNVEAPSHGE